MLGRRKNRLLKTVIMLKPYFFKRFLPSCPVAATILYALVIIDIFLVKIIHNDPTIYAVVLHEYVDKGRFVIQLLGIRRQDYKVSAR